MPVLYTMPETCALAPNIVAHWTKAPIEIKTLKRGDQKSPEYLSINPHGKVPALQFNDGFVLTEAAAIMQHIAMTTDGSLWPSNKRDQARIVEALSFMASEVHADFGPHFAADTFADEKGAKQEIKQKAYEKLARHYATLDDTLTDSGSDWYLGERSPADAYLYVLTRWIDQTPLKIADYPTLKTFRDRMQDDPDVLASLDSQRMTTV